MCRTNMLLGGPGQLTPLLLLLVLPADVSGHGYLHSSRNHFAFTDGKSWLGPNDDGDVLPKIEYCPHCLNKAGVCGSSGTLGYDVPLTENGGILPFDPKRVYTEGDVIELDVTLTAHHKGHFEYKSCKLTGAAAVPTQACFDGPGNALEFVSDVYYGAPIDPNHKGRAYIPPSDFPSAQYGDNPYGMMFKHRFKLPDGLYGDKVLIQWHYITGNSCEDEGYKDYAFPPGWEGGNATTCSQPLPVVGVPEQFWNCMEVQILAAGPVPPTVPAPTPPAPAPTPPAPTATPPAPTMPTTPTMVNMCGTSWSHASSTCGQTACPSGNSTVCPPGEYCYADVDAGGCGADDAPTAAAPTAATPTAGAAPTPPSVGGTNFNYCGTSWGDANGRCATACPGGTDGECPTGEMCFADCTSCTGNTGPAPTPPAATPTAPTPVQPATERPTYPPVPPGVCDEGRRMVVNMGYYQSWAVWRPATCNRVLPNEIDVSGMGYTHLLYSFASIDASFGLQPYFGDYAGEVPRYTQFNSLKANHPGLKTLIAVGGWTHNNPGTDTCDRFSQAGSTEANRVAFANSVVDFLVLYGFDGIDLDWEYPSDASRCGDPANDKVNYALLVEAIRAAFYAAGHYDFLITMAVPVSTSRLGQGYDLPRLAQTLDYINVMSYDIAGSWDSVVGSHTDMTYIGNTLNYMLGQGVPSHKLVMGLAAYGRTFTLSDPANCMDVGCPSNGAANGGCAGDTGYVPLFTLLDTIQGGSYQKLELNSATGSMELVTNANEFISFDDQGTFQLKVDRAYDECMGGYMWWAVDMIEDSFALQAGGGADTSDVTDAPTASPVETATDDPTAAPVQDETETETPTAAPVEGSDAPTAAPVEATDDPTFQPTDAPTSAPEEAASGPQEYTDVATTPRCGKNELDARERCHPTCTHNGQCPVGEYCWGTHPNYCGDVNYVPPNYVHTAQASTVWHRCGKTGQYGEVDARSNCGLACTHSIQCAAGETCYAVHSNYCGNAIAADERRNLRVLRRG